MVREYHAPPRSKSGGSSGAKTPLPRFDRLSDVAKFNQDAQLKAEENNVKTCLNFAREQLSL